MGYNYLDFKIKLQNFLWAKVVHKFRYNWIYNFLYRSYWHYFLNSKNIKSGGINFYTAKPNPGAGIGHQMANWIAGYWFARKFGLQFTHSSFSNKNWEKFLGFGEKEKMPDNLINEGYKKVLLPLFDENNADEIKLAQRIIASYNNKKVVFIAEQDQFYSDQFGVIDDIKNKFYSSISRKSNKLIYANENYNIALHVRRGDIVIGQENNNPNLMIRWQGNDYFEKVLTNVVKNIVTKKPIFIYLFSQGVKNDFIEFNHFDNLHFCLDMNAQNSFLHMVYADLLITSKSSFSYKPALLSNGIKVCPKDFWHGYPPQNDWILTESDGTFDINQLNKY